jgi:hypothetical protein
MFCRPLIIALAACLAVSAPASAQTLSATPVLFGDPVPGANPAHGELVLGRTTLRGALRMFAVELEADSVRVSLAHEGNPARLPGTEMLIGGLTIHPHHVLDLGPGRYTLYFDEHERLVAAHGAPPSEKPLRRSELARRYPTLRVSYDGRSAEGVTIYEGLEAPLDKCVSLTGGVWLQRGDAVEGLGYVYTCPTKPASPENK